MSGSGCRRDTSTYIKVDGGGGGVARDAICNAASYRGLDPSIHDTFIAITA
jgi:hypothetical protein